MRLGAQCVNEEWISTASHKWPEVTAPVIVFVSHASEDKNELVRPLAHALRKRGLKVWYDEFSLVAGDSLRRSIDRGLASCTAGVVVLSPAFFAKEWPQRELDALYSAEIAGRARIIPIWHGVDAKTIASISPLLADRVAIRSSIGVDGIAAMILEQYPAPAKYSGGELAVLLERCVPSGRFGGDALIAGCRHRFLALNAFKENYCQLADETISKLSYTELENLPSSIEQYLEDQHDHLRLLHGIPDDVYLTYDDPVRDYQQQSFLEDIESWVSGTLTQAESTLLVRDLDYVELDEYYVLLGLPNFSFSQEQRELLELAVVEMGCGYENDYQGLRHICEKLRKLDSSA